MGRTTIESPTIFDILAATFTPTLIFITGLALQDLIVTIMGIIFIGISYIRHLTVTIDLIFCTVRKYTLTIGGLYILMVVYFNIENQEFIRRYLVGLVIYYMVFINYFAKDYETVYKIGLGYLNQLEEKGQDDKGTI